MTKAFFSACILVQSLLDPVSAGDPADGWMAYARFAAHPTDTITRVKATTTVPPLPPKSGSTVGWWYGLQTAKGDGALIQLFMPAMPIGEAYEMFFEMDDWTPPGKIIYSPFKDVQPNDILTAEITSTNNGRTFVQNMTSSTGASSSYSYTLMQQQKETESALFFVCEKQGFFYV